MQHPVSPGPSRRALLVAGAAPLTTPRLARAQGGAWPGTQTVSVIIPYAPGGASDVVGRLLTMGLQERLGGTFVMDHRPGASTGLAARHVARAKPDGLTLLLGTIATFTLTPIAFRDPGYDPIADFAHITIALRNAVAPGRAAALVRPGRVAGRREGEARRAVLRELGRGHHGAPADGGPLRPRRGRDAARPLQRRAAGAHRHDRRPHRLHVRPPRRLQAAPGLGPPPRLGDADRRPPRRPGGCAHLRRARLPRLPSHRLVFAPGPARHASWPAFPKPPSTPSRTRARGK